MPGALEGHSAILGQPNARPRTPLKTMYAPIAALRTMPVVAIPLLPKRRSFSPSVMPMNCGTRREADKALTEILSRLDRGTYVAPSKQTFGHYPRAVLEDGGEGGPADHVLDLQEPCREDDHPRTRVCPLAGPHCRTPRRVLRRTPHVGPQDRQRRTLSGRPALRPLGNPQGAQRSGVPEPPDAPRRRSGNAAARPAISESTRCRRERFAGSPTT